VVAVEFSTERSKKKASAGSFRAREGSRVVNVAVVIATGVTTDGRREILGVATFTSEDEAAWLDFLRSLVERGLTGNKLVISDAHTGPVAAIESAMVGASWQRRRTSVVGISPHPRLRHPPHRRRPLRTERRMGCRTTPHGPQHSCRRPPGSTKRSYRHPGRRSPSNPSQLMLDPGSPQ
jgi:hypothetical protein